ncbi:MAG: hypothetical protein ACRBCK_12575 [Alphaproteobacteria bacterium]
MSKINQIENALLELEGGKFQKVCNAYFAAKGYAVHALGSVAGSDKAKIGTPDCFMTSQDGRFTFVEYTAQQSGVCDKFKGDIVKCLDEAKTGVPRDDIELIVLCYNARQVLSPEELRELYGACEGIPLEVYGLSTLANSLYNDHRNIVRDELNITLDTGQIFSLEDFVEEYGKNKASTPLDNPFLYREEELKTLTDGLDEKNLILLSGVAGVGKTKLALEAIRKYRESRGGDGLYIHCVKSHGQPLYEDIKDYVSKDGEHIVLVDDANRISSVQYIFELAQKSSDTRNIKVIATVRDYALRSIGEKAKGIDALEVIIKPFEEGQIVELLKASYGVTNPDYVRIIWTVSHGNPRIALMAARVAKEKQTLDSLRNLEAVYDDYFSSIREELEGLNNPNVLKVGAIIAFFRSVDIENQEQMGLVTGIFSISRENFSEIAFNLRDMEIVDAFDSKVFKISDQVLSTYLFYLATFKNEVLSFSDLLNNFALTQTDKFRDALYPCLNTFNAKEMVENQIETHVDVLWNKLDEQSDHDNLEIMISLFGFMRTTKVLLYIRDKIAGVSAVTQDISQISFEAKSSSNRDFIIKTLGNFVYVGAPDEVKQAIELLLGYAVKRLDLIDNILYALTHDFGIGRDSFNQQYQVQMVLLEVLEEKINAGIEPEYFSKILSVIAFSFLKTKHVFVESNSARSMNYCTVSLLFDDALKAFREVLWRCISLTSEYASPSDVFSAYLDVMCDIEEKEVVEYDAPILLGTYLGKLSSPSFNDIRVVRELFDRLGTLDIPCDQDALEEFKSAAYDLWKLFSDDVDLISELGYKEFQIVQKENIKLYVKEHKAESPNEFFDDLKAIDVALTKEDYAWKHSNGLNLLYEGLYEDDPDYFLRLLDVHFDKRDFGRLEKNRILLCLFESLDVAEVFSLIEGCNLSDETLWLLSAFHALPEDKCIEEHVDKIISLYAREDMVKYNFGLNYLLKFKVYRSSIVEDVVELILEKEGDNVFCQRSLSSLFGYGTTKEDLLDGSFVQKFDLLKRAYFAQLECSAGGLINHDADDLIMFIDRDPDFLLACVDYIFKKERKPSYHNDSTNYTFLWEMDNYQELMEGVFDHVYAIKAPEYGDPYINVFFQKVAVENTKVQQRQTAFVDYLLEKHAEDGDRIRYIFHMSDGFGNERRLHHIKSLLRVTSDVSLFKEINFIPNQSGWSGSQIPSLQAENAFLDRVLSQLRGIDFLEHKAHVEELLVAQRGRISFAEKWEFLHSE